MSDKDDKSKSEELMEGWEDLLGGDEPAEGGALKPSQELEMALEEAAAAVDDAGRSVDLELEGEDLLERAPAGGATLESELEETRSKLDSASLELDQLRERVLRLHADYENFRRRALRDRQEALHYGQQNLVKDLLSTVDNLDRAIDHARQSEGGDLQSLLRGVELARRELLGVMAKYGVTEIDAQGKPFDPALHEAMGQTEAEVEPNTIVEVLEKGYQLRDRLVRPARVLVAAAPERSRAGGENGDGDPEVTD